MPRKLVSGKSLQVRGLKELEAKARNLVDACKGGEASAIIRDVTQELRHELVAAAMSVRVPHEVLDDIFTWNKPHPSDKGRGRVTALIGVRKAGRHFDAKAYVTWYPGKRMAKGATEKMPKIGKKLVLPGTISAKGAEYGKQKIGESLATMWEVGTSLKPARPFFRPTINGARSRIYEQLAAGYRAIIARHAR